MRKLAIITIILVSSLYVKAQLFSEIQEINGKWHIELVNNVKFKIRSLNIITEAEGVHIDTAQVKQSVIDSLNKSNAIVVITEDSLTSNLISDKYGNIFQLRINDSINSIRFICKHPCIKNGESVIFIDSATLRAGNYNIPAFNVKFDYFGKSSPSLGKKNKREDAFAIIKGNFLNNGSPFRNVKFTIRNGWRLEDGNDTLATDNEGHFEFARWSNVCNIIDRYYGVCVLNTKFAGFAWFSNDTIQLGINNYDMYFTFSNLDSLKASTKLQITPSPASTQLQVSYTLSAELHYADCRLQLSNAQGQTLQNIALEATESTLQVELNKAIGNGLYFCSLVSKGVVYKTVQFMVQR